MSNSQIIKVTLDIVAKTGSLFCLVVIYAGIPVGVCVLWYLGMKVLTD